VKLSDLTCALLRQQGHLGTQFPSACQKKSGIQRTIVWSRLWKSQALNRTGVATMPAYKGMTVRLCYVTESGARRVHGLPRQALLPVNGLGYIDRVHFLGVKARSGAQQERREGKPPTQLESSL
jgi:hypothetical protein